MGENQEGALRLMKRSLIFALYAVTSAFLPSSQMLCLIGFQHLLHPWQLLVDGMGNVFVDISPFNKSSIVHHLLEKISNINEMSAVDVVFSSGIC